MSIRRFYIGPEASWCDHGNFARGLAEIPFEGSFAVGYPTEVVVNDSGPTPMQRLDAPAPPKDDVILSS